MSPQQVPAEWVDAVELALADRCNDEHEGGRDWCGCPDENDVRLVLAAVLPLAQAAALRELATMMPADWQRPNGPADLARAHADHVLECRCAEEREGSPS
jgi:hypothetical protein